MSLWVFYYYITQILCFSLLLSFASFVTISPFLYHCFKVMSLVGIFPQSGFNRINRHLILKVFLVPEQRPLQWTRFSVLLHDPCLSSFSTSLSELYFSSIYWQAFQYTFLDEFRQDEACLDVSQSHSGAKITFYGCHELKGNQEFKYTSVRENRTLRWHALTLDL